MPGCGGARRNSRHQAVDEETIAGAKGSIEWCALSSGQRAAMVMGRASPHSVGDLPKLHVLAGVAVALHARATEAVHLAPPAGDEPLVWLGDEPPAAQHRQQIV